MKVFHGRPSTSPAGAPSGKGIVSILVGVLASMN